MKRIIRNIFTRATSDALIRARVFGDEILHAIPPGRILCLGTVWKGQLAPGVQGVTAAITSSFAAPGLSTGRVLHAEPAPETLNLGRRWLGNLSTKLLAASADFASAQRPEEAGTEPGTDVTEVLEQLDRLRRDMGTRNAQTIADGVRRLRDAAERVSQSLKEDQPHGAFSEGRRIADAARQRIADLNKNNREFHAARSVTPHVDSATGKMHWRTGDAVPTQRAEFRDAMHAARQAATPRDRITAMNRAAKSFWSSGEPPTVTADMARMPPATSVADINARNRLFWSERV